jgi:hypothetical protein
MKARIEFTSCTKESIFFRATCTFTFFYEIPYNENKLKRFQNWGGIKNG